MTLLLPAPAPARDRLDARDRTVLIVHAHPDDEAIFTGLTIRRLADAGARVVLVTATGGDLGGSLVPLRPGETVAARRLAELERAAAILGVARVVPLGYRDSGLPDGPDGTHPAAFAAAGSLAVARRLADLALAERAEAVVHDDGNGIYGHPDHVAVHRAGRTAARLAGIPAYESTVDREHLHFAGPGAHLVHAASTAASRAAARGYGHVTAEIGLALAGTPEELAAKRAAMLAHASQIRPESVTATTFGDAYELEWFLRTGPAGLLDRLGNAHAVAAG